jgi:hypothetical protein
MCPCGSAQLVQKLQDHAPLLSKTGWILAHCVSLSKRKMNEEPKERSHAIHNFSTSTRNVQVQKNSSESGEICGSGIGDEGGMPRNGAFEAEENFGKNFNVFDRDDEIHRCLPDRKRSTGDFLPPG